MVHYNSWYDFYSYQDEGFNGGFKDRRPNVELIAKLRPDVMSEKSCLQRVQAFGTELVEKRNVTIDSFLWDDGWDDTSSLWQMDRKRFPNNFSAVSALAAKFGSGTGVWISPWGGYGFPQEQRVAYGKQFGWETNYNERVEAEAFSLAGTKYRNAFHDLAVAFVREQGVNMFKFDGVAGDPKELAAEMDAMLKVIDVLRETTADTRVDVQGEKKGKPNSDSVWINLTTGTWASPFFLMWADSIWRGGPDIPVYRNDWEPRGGDDGLTRRQRWIRWRSSVVYLNVVRYSRFFPISQLMIHGVIVASHGDALHWGLNEYNDVDFAQEVWSFVGLGLQLQELYIAPRYMNPQAWDLLSEGLTWARREVAVLRDSHWAFGNPSRAEVYATAAWSVEDGRGFLFMHNPSGNAQDSISFSLAEALELPAQQRTKLSIAVVKSIPATKGTEFKSWDCVPSARAHRGPKVVNLCAQQAEDKVHVRMTPTEVLVLEVSLASR